MKLTALAAAAVVMSLPLSAGAVTTFTVLDDSTQGAGNTADIYAAGYGAYTPTGGTWSEDPGVYPPPAVIGSVYVTPFLNTSIESTQSFYSVWRDDFAGEGAPTPQTLSFGAGGPTEITMLWGSLDTYNEITFSDGTSFTGGDIYESIFGAGSAIYTRLEHVALVSFMSDVAISSITFASIGDGAFEFAFAQPVPAPLGFLLIGSAFAGVAAVSRRRRKATAA